MTHAQPRPGPPRPGRRPAGARPRATTGRGPGRRDPRPRRPHRGGARRAARRPSVVGIDRDPQALELGRRAAGAVRRAVHPRARGVRRDPRRARRARPRVASTACCSTSASPRCSSTSASAASPTPRTRRSTCGWTTPTGPTAADVLNTYPAERAGPGPARVRRGAVRPPDRRGRRPGARAREPFTDVGPAGRAALRRRSRRPPGVPAATRPSAPSRRCASRSTTSSACCAGRSRPRSTRSASAAAWWSSPTTRSRTGWSSRRSPPRTRSTCRPTCRSCPTGYEPALRLVTRGAEKADAAEIADNPRAASVRLRAVERVRSSRAAGARTHERSEHPMSSAARPGSAPGSRGSPRPPSSGPG